MGPVKRESMQRQIMPVGDDWEDQIGIERKRDLWMRLRKWWEEADHRKGKGPFAGERLADRDVLWLAVCALANQEECALENARSRLSDGAGWREIKLPSLCLSEANLLGVNLQGAELSGAQMQKANLFAAHLQRASLNESQLQGADLSNARMEEAYLSNAQLKGASLFGARLGGADLLGADLEGVDLFGAQLEGAGLSGATLTHADLRQVSLDKNTDLTNAVLTDVRIDRVIFDNVNLSVVDWTLVPTLQDERLARQVRYDERYWNEVERGKPKSSAFRKDEFQAAARAYRRLTVALQNNGMSEEAAKYAYRAQLMQRAVYRYSGWGALGQWLFSWFLWLIAGYGYRPGRSVIVYLASVALFAVGYFVLGVTVGPHLSPYEAAVVSLTAFHGRGFFATAFQPGDPQAGLAALEAVFGLLIEISFIATFTQRFFGAK